MPSQPEEKPQEDISNALTMLNAEEPYESRGQRWVEYAADDIEAIRARLEAALAKLEAPREGILLRAEGDSIVREWPRLASEDRALMGQDVDADGE